MRACHLRITERRITLQFLDHLLILFVCSDGADADTDDFNAAQLLPLLGQNIVQYACKLGRVSRQGAVANPHLGDLCKRRLERSQQLCFQLAVDAIPRILRCNIAAHVLIEQHRVGHSIGILAKAADTDVHIQTDIPIHNAEGNRIGRAVLVADEFFGVEIIDALILAGISSERETLLQLLPRRLDPIAQAAVENTRLGRAVPDKLAGFCAELNDRALLDNHHALTFIHGDDGAIRDDVVLALVVGAAARGTLYALDCKHILRHSLAIEILSPLISEHAAQRADSCL